MSFFSFTPSRHSPTGSYKIEVISLPEECDWEENLPVEIQYLFAKHPEYKEKIRTILSNGKAIGVRTMLRTPENILRAVHTISVHSQRNFIITWLPDLLRSRKLPIITERDRKEAGHQKEDMPKAIVTILHHHLDFKKLVLIDEENRGVSAEEQAFMTELSELIYPLAVDYAVFRITADNAHERTEIAQGIIKTLFIIGPIAHVLEKFASGIGKVFAASTDDLLGETAELMALRGSGFTWKELLKRSRILVPVFALATWGAFSVEPLIEEGRILWAGAVFGLSAVALSLTTAIQSFFMYRRNLEKLAAEGKVALKDSWSITKGSLKQDFTNPARLGLLLGSGLAPIMGMLGAVSGLMHNGWILAAIGSTESIVAGITVISATKINDWRFHRKLKKEIASRKQALNAKPA